MTAYSPRTRKRFSDEEVSLLLSMYRQGIPGNEIARHFKCSKSYPYRLAQQHGMSPRGHVRSIPRR
jgi:hypothetical protein